MTYLWPFSLKSSHTFSYSQNSRVDSAFYTHAVRSCGIKPRPNPNLPQRKGATHMLRLRLRWTHLHFICIPAVQINFISRPNIRLFIAQLVEHCSANTEAMGSNPVEALKILFGLKFAIAYIAITTAIITSPFLLYCRSSNQLQSTSHSCHW